MKKTLLPLVCVFSATVSSVVAHASHEDVAVFLGREDFSDDLVTLDVCHSFSLKNRPWSGPHWTLAEGAAAKRYRDPGFPKKMDWKENSDYAQTRMTPDKLIAEGRIDQLSPAEKYDLLTDPLRRYRFTSQHWDAGRSHYERWGKVEPWSCLGDGAQAAAIRFPEPTQAVTLISADGKTSIEFTPADIKALASAYFSSTPYSSRYLGWRCDGEEGSKCTDIAADDFHLALIHQLGMNGRATVMDREVGAKVVNRTIYGYDYSYFQPASGLPKNEALQAMTLRSEWTDDPYAAIRSPSAKYLIGVKMKVATTIETRIDAEQKESPAESERTMTEYVYDLEIDENFKIIGGQWHQTEHPDFFWAPDWQESLSTEGGHAEGNRRLPTWVGMRLPSEWRAAADVDVEEGRPLFEIVEELMKRSRP